MPHNPDIEKRINKIVSSWNKVESKKMFGGICYIMAGNMFSGVYKDFLILRLGESNAAEALKLPHVKPFDITGRPMKGWVMVAQDGFACEEPLMEWLDQARGFAGKLPPK